MAEQADIGEARAKLSADGFVILHSVIAADALEQLCSRVALFYQGWDQYPASTRKELAAPGPKNDHQPVREINWPTAAHQLLANEPAVVSVRHVIEALSDGPCQLIHVNSLLKPAHNGAPIAPHQDTAYNIRTLNDPLTTWIPFEEVSEENGAVFYVAGSHKLGDIQHQGDRRMRWLSDQQIRDIRKPIVTYAGALGSIGVHDSQIIHGSYPNRSQRDRLALSLRFERV